MLPSTSSIPAISIKGVRVDYESFTAVKGLDLEIYPGQIFGLIGPNGAGKTSTFKVLSTLLEPTYGEVYIDGIDIAEQPAEARRKLGSMQDLAPVPTDLKVWEFMDCFAHAYELNKTERRQRIKECLEMVDLTGKRDAMCKSLSRGMTQRVVLAKCLLHSPRVLLLDEPASGMDPVSRVRLRDTIQELSRKGVAVLISSHILTELSSVCSHIGILNHGELLDHGPTRDVIQRMTKDHSFRFVRIKTLGANTELAVFLNTREGVLDLTTEESQVRFKFSGSPQDQVDLLKAIVQQGIPITSFEETETNIEDILLELNVTPGNTSQPPPLNPAL
ncbi:MAG: ABC transporter ATP-binding protein [Lentimonas sp.]